MKAASAALKTLLAGAVQQLVTADMWTITLVDGTVIRLTSCDQALTVSGNTYQPCGAAGNPMLKRGKVAPELGSQVSEMDITVNAGPSDLLEGQAWLAAINAGKLDYATVRLDMFISDSWSNTTRGLVYMFIGRVADVQVDRATATVKVKSPMELLDLYLPRNVEAPGCWHTLYDGGCNAQRSLFTVSGTVSTAPSITQITTNIPTSAPDHLFDLGTLTFTSGTLAGIRRTVRSSLSVSGTINFSFPLPSLPANGDAFTIVPGCDKQQATCGISLLAGGSSSQTATTTETYTNNNAPFQYTVANSLTFVSDGGVTFLGGAALTNIAYVPGQDPGFGNYMFNAGTYFFSGAPDPSTGLPDSFSITYTYNKTVTVLGQLQFTASGSTLTATGHGLTNGQALKLGTTGSLPAPLATATVYFVIVVDANNFKLATTLANALAGTNIVLTNAGSGTNYATEKGKFANLQNAAGGGFGGHPYIPAPETSL